MHPLNDITTVIEDAPDVFCVHRTGKVGVTIVPAVSARRADPQKLVPDEVFCSCDARVLTRLWYCVVWCCVSCKLWKILLNFRFSGQNLLSEQVLLVEEENH